MLQKLLAAQAACLEADAQLEQLEGTQHLQYWYYNI
jgi:hypothetical protein